MMIITCPNCGTHYNLDPGAIKPTGSMLKCVRCSFSWQQVILQAAPLIQQAPHTQNPAAMAEVPAPAPTFAPQPTPEPEPAPEPVTAPPMPDFTIASDDDADAGLTPPPLAELPAVSADTLDDSELDALLPEEDLPGLDSMVKSDEVNDAGDDVANYDEIPDPEAIPEVFSEPRYHSDDDDEESHEGAGRKTKAILTLTVLIIALIGGAIFGRGYIVNAWPDAAQYYAMAGLKNTEALGAGLTIRNVKSERGEADGVETLVVRGEIANISDMAKNVPLVKVSLLNQEGEEVQSTTVTPSSPELPPIEAISFEATLRDPPPTARRMEVTFTARAE